MVIIRKIVVFLDNIGINIRKFYSYRYLFRFAKDRSDFLKLGGVYTNLQPILDNYDESAGSNKGHYFHQDLLVATFINKHNPERHIDVGSRIDGFVAHVASFRKIEVMDIRELPDFIEGNIKFHQADLTNIDSSMIDMCDSLSCLHAIEHFGLGRYGDKIDPDGHIKGFINLCKMLKTGGRLYLSFPISIKPRVIFNSNRVFSPQEVLLWLEIDGINLLLERYDYIDDNGNLHLDQEIKSTKKLDFGCGIYTFIKK